MTISQLNRMSVSNVASTSDAFTGSDKDRYTDTSCVAKVRGMEQKMDARVDALIGALHNDPRRSISELAASINLSPSRMRHIFKQHTTLTISAFDKQVRLQRGRQLLESTFLSVKEVSAACGFATSSHFCREFKKAFGVRPSAMRR